jgi:alkylation response protein AidB-like acyl-CoA dehydrogenase
VSLCVPAVELDGLLADPRAAPAPWGFADAVRLDEQDAYPEDACAALDRWGLPEHYIPASEGGRLERLDAGLLLLRTVARRDLTVAIAHAKTLLGAMPVWLDGDAHARARAAARIRRGEQISLAVTERAHGADLLAGELTAEPDGSDWVLRGEKWLINNATRSSALCVLARTDPGGGPRGFSFFLVEKDQLAAGTWRPLPRARTHGIRGADISGICLSGARVPATALLGEAGHGLDTALRGFQVTRTLCSGLSLGALDAALACTAAFADERKLYAARMAEIPAVRAGLADAFLDLLVCEGASLVACRAVHALPEQMSLISAVVKYFVPVTVQAAIDRLAVLLGARAHLRGEHWSGVFQKIRRDHAVVPLFDGSSFVNLYALALQLQNWGRRQLREAAAEAAAERLAAAADLDAPEPLDFTRLVTMGTGQDDVVSGAARAFAQLSEDPALQEPVREHMGALAQWFEGERRALAERAAGAAPASPLRMRPEVFELSERYCRLWVAASLLHLFRGSRTRLAVWAQGGEWLVCALARLSSAGSREPGVREWAYALARMAGADERLRRPGALLA